MLAQDSLELGDFAEGLHECPMPASDVPNTMLSRGKYRTETLFYDASGTLLWRVTSAFHVIKPPSGGAGKHVPCSCFA